MNGRAEGASERAAERRLSTRSEAKGMSGEDNHWQNVYDFSVCDNWTTLFNKEHLRGSYFQAANKSL